jgi:hypothetical protein
MNVPPQQGIQWSQRQRLTQHNAILWADWNSQISFMIYRGPRREAYPERIISGNPVQRLHMTRRLSTAPQRTTTRLLQQTFPFRAFLVRSRP